MASKVGDYDSLFEISDASGKTISVFFSNYCALALTHIMEFLVDNVVYNSLQQYLEAEKCKFFGDHK
ncbi:MAG: hypothetical protein MJA29_11600, partial [Candidatus Omnitrophica bacterium]|nr:hypothetical protein [Candidatus Omnitrophota bacterium]